ncbi:MULTISPECIES: response regulator transcription factor [Neobacillus]|jgi:two-component system, response regulator YesN|uniref:response regulator transcription factor n=1 Tax=Neobacillus TaxID=2675232 RepID=UPI0027E1FE66|nr:response regulator [Neobacillus sp. PS2-9]WML58973.1 response regulator [Neobacillus sp. PS2-9]
MNILLVDDEYLEIEQLRFLIHRKYPLWNIFSAEDSVSAWKITEQESIHLAFIDIRMPGEDGLTLSKRLKEKQSGIEIVIVSAHQDFSYAKRAIQAEVMDYLVKPVIEQELLAVIEKYLEVNKHAVAKSAHVQYVIKKIELHFSGKLSLQEIADEIPVSASYLSHLFSEEIGSTFQEYLLTYRIHQAKKLIISKADWSMSRIAEATGFSSQHHFSNIFKKVEGMTPSMYKEKRG